MANLFIIGNGFDLDHGLHTSYSNFREYLDALKLNENQIVLDLDTDDADGGVYSAIKKQSILVSNLIKILDHVNGGTWKDVEYDIGNIDLDFYFPDESIKEDEDGDPDESANSHVSYITSLDLDKNLNIIPQLFSSWIKTINIKGVLQKKDFLKLFSASDFFLTFNYTETLEEVYSIKNICHIHGKQNEEIFFGHGETSQYSDIDYVKRYDQMSEAEEVLEKIEHVLKKDTKKALLKHKFFFNSLNNIDNIYSYGFSYSDVDKIYLEEIFKIINTKNITWYFNDYDENEHGKYQNVLRECKFDGNFSVFPIEN